MKVLVYPPNSMILSDLVERGGHEAVVLMKEIGEHVRDAEIDAPPINITEEDLKRAWRRGIFKTDILRPGDIVR